ncbi:MAG: hypothetical protein KAU38_16640 [Desulfobacterales bacterium]|nr:hypothetical protein [Desulfobacterales bacterium]
MPLAIDTLNIYSRLKATGLSEESARGIAEVFRETVEENLASKKDLEVAKGEIRKDIELLRAELKKDIELLRAELKKDIESVRKEIAESRAGTIRWVAGMLVAQAALIATLVKLL